MAITCIDVSTWQGNIDWPAVKRAGITHAIIRIGFSTTADNKFERNYSLAKQAGIKVGGYWYSNATSNTGAKAEANACLQIIGSRKFDLPVYYDIEESAHWSMGKTNLTNMIKTFCSIIKSKLGSAGVYSSASVYGRYIDYDALKGTYSIWIAQWSSSRPEKECDIWQNSETGRVSGISGNVDTNVILGNFKGSTASGMNTNNKQAWDFLISVAGFSKESAASCIGFWLAENGYQYGATYPNVTPPYVPGTKNPYKYLDRELFPAEVEGYFFAYYPGNAATMGNPPQSLINYTRTYKPNGSSYDGYCGIGMGSWTFQYGAGALIKYAQEKAKKWDDLELQLNFAIDAYSGKYAPYGSIGNPSAYAKRNQTHGCTENNFWPGIAWFVAWEMPSYYGSIAKCKNYLEDKYERYARNVYKEFKDTEIGAYYGVSTGASGGTVSDPNDVINAEAIDALIISLDETVKKVDYATLMDNHVSGVIMKAGSYFTADHKIKESYKNPNLKLQIDGAVKAGIRFGLYADVRARSVAEAEKECEQLYYVVSKYPPALGLWLHIMFTQSKTVNHKILDYYLSQLQKWGFTPGCGLYCTKEELSKIDWSKYQEDFFLWYVNRFTNSSELEQLDKVLTPEFFVIT